MTLVILPESKAYHEEQVDDFFCALVLNDDIYEWLVEHCSQDWDHLEGPNGECHIEISDPKIALLFKLTWGGV